MTAVIVGASSGIGRAIAERLAIADPKRVLLLVGSDSRDLDAIAQDLRHRHAASATHLAIDIAAEPEVGKRIANALIGLPTASVLVLAAGWSVDDDDLTLDAATIDRLLATNLRAPVAIVHALLPALLDARGVVVGFGSVAAVRGRGRNVVYAAAKRGLESLFESLRQRHAPDELAVQLWRLGFVDTNLTFGMRLPLPAASADDVARAVANRIERGGSATRTFPRWWALVALALRLLPWAIYRRLKA